RGRPRPPRHAPSRRGGRRALRPRPGRGAGAARGRDALLPPRGARAPPAARGTPAFVRGPGLGGRVVGAAGPWRIAAQWWSTPLARDYWDLELTDGGIYRCYHERDSARWFVDGVYD